MFVIIARLWREAEEKLLRFIASTHNRIKKMNVEGTHQEPIQVPSTGFEPTYSGDIPAKSALFMCAQACMQEKPRLRKPLEELVHHETF